MLNIDSIVNRVGALATGNSLSLIEVSKYYNDRGDSDFIENAHEIDGVVQIVSAQDDEVKEGILLPGDIICFFDENELNYIKLKEENILLYNNKKYRITNVVVEIGHTEVHAKKL